MWHGSDCFCVPQLSHQTRTSLQTHGQRIGIASGVEGRNESGINRETRIEKNDQAKNGLFTKESGDTGVEHQHAAAGRGI